jgi:hypothetical protein
MNRQQRAKQIGYGSAPCVHLRTMGWQVWQADDVPVDVRGVCGAVDLKRGGAFFGPQCEDLLEYVCPTW